MTLQFSLKKTTLPQVELFLAIFIIAYVSIAFRTSLHCTASSFRVELLSKTGVSFVCMYCADSKWIIAMTEGR